MTLFPSFQAADIPKTLNHIISCQFSQQECLTNVSALWYYNTKFFLIETDTQLPLLLVILILANFQSSKGRRLPFPITQ